MATHIFVSYITVPNSKFTHVTGNNADSTYLVFPTDRYSQRVSNIALIVTVSRSTIIIKDPKL